MTLEDKIKEIEKMLADLKVEVRIKYPIYCRSKLNGEIAKFTGLTNGECIYIQKTQQPHNEVGSKNIGYVPHTDEEVWEEIVYDEKRGLFDKQVVWCWDYVGHYKAIGFYDAINRCTFLNNHRNGEKWDKYEAVEPTQIPQFMKDEFECLEK